MTDAEQRPAEPLAWLLPSWALWTARAAGRHMPLLLAASAFVAVVVKVLRVSGGDPAVALAVLDESDKAQMALGSGVLVAPGALASAAALAVVVAARACAAAASALAPLRGDGFERSTPDQRQAAAAATAKAAAAVLVALLLVALVAFLAPWGNALVVGAVVLMVGLLELAQRLARRAGAGDRAARAAEQAPVAAIVVVSTGFVAAVAGLTLQLLLGALNDDMWLPARDVVLRDGSGWTGYRLGGGEPGRVYLLEPDRSIRVVPASEVVSEEICRTDSLLDTRPLARLATTTPTGGPRGAGGSEPQDRPRGALTGGGGARQRDAVKGTAPSRR